MKKSALFLSILFIGLLIAAPVSAGFSEWIKSIFTGNVIDYSICSDEDNGNIFIKGSITGTSSYNSPIDDFDYCTGSRETPVPADSCSGPNCGIYEYQCLNNEAVASFISCPDGCYDGACIYREPIEMNVKRSVVSTNTYTEVKLNITSNRNIISIKEFSTNYIPLNVLSYDPSNNYDFLKFNSNKSEWIIADKDNKINTILTYRTNKINENSINGTYNYFFEGYLTTGNTIKGNITQTSSSTVDCHGSDTNKDGNVDLIDLTNVGDYKGRTDCSKENNWCSGADTNKDGNVDLIDLTTLGEYYGTENCEI